MSDTEPRASIKLPSDFVFGELRPDHTKPAPPAPPPPLGPLSAFVGDWVGNGFNTIFRPDSSATPTPLPNPIPPPPPPRDNILELNLTSESLSFSPRLGSVPNRGTGAQPDAFLNGVPYLQTISDITIHGESVGIHVEPGIWIHVPATTIPQLGETVTRMASIPHGATIEAQGLVDPAKPGPPTIAAVDITPSVTGSNPVKKVTFASQTASNPNTPRIPQDLGPFITRGTITQAMLDDPNSLLRAHISKQNIISTTTIFVSTAPPPPVGLFGGGTDNIAFLLGQPAVPPPAPNAQALQMTAVFWIETVEEVIKVGPYRVGDAPHLIKARRSVPGQRVPRFSVTPPFDLDKEREITVTFKQIQYSQTVLLNFAGLTWPHVSVNTLVPADDIIVPPSVWK
ncbi:MAG: heme-binding protein [Candidatus Sulfotelmatobacter sp.]